MRHVNWALTLLLAAVLIGCSGSHHSQEAPGSESPNAVRNLGQAANPQLPVDAEGRSGTNSLAGRLISSFTLDADASSPMDPSTAGLFAQRDSGLPSLAELEHSSQRSASGVGREWQDGTGYASKSSNAVETSTSLSMFTGAGQRNWAIYRLQDVTGALGFERVVVETSNTNFTGSNPGFIVGIANYDTGRWQVLDISDSEIYARSITSFEGHVSALGNVYIFVMTHDGNGIQLDRVGFDVDRNPPSVSSVSPTSGETGTQIQPLASISETVDSYSWDFGGGATPDTSSEESPLITLGAVGSYDASLTVSTIFGEDTYDFVLEVGELSISPPEIVSVEPLSAETGSVVDFSAVVNGSVDSWSWDFDGAGNPGTSDQPEPQVTLGSPGSYDCNLQVSNFAGTDSFDFVFEVLAAGSPPEITAVEPLSGTSGEEISFTPTYTGSVDSWSWNFADAASPSSSTDEQPLVTLGDPGTYSCSVRAVNGSGEDTFNFQFTVDPAGEAPVIVSVDPLSGESGAAATFTPSFTGTVDSWDWQFGDAASPSTSTDVQPMVTLGDPGIYACSVMAANTSGSDTLNFNLEVTAGEVSWQWTEVDMSSITGTDGGWTPAVAVASNGNPMVAYADRDAATNKPFVLIGDSTLDLATPASWTPVDILGATAAPAPPAYMDIVIPAGTNLPRVSLVYAADATTPVEQNSLVGFSALEIEAEIPTWYTYFLGNEATPSVPLDGAFSSSIDFDPTDSHIGITTCTANSNLPAKPVNDMYYYDLAYDPLNPGSVSYTLNYNFGNEWRFPHMRYEVATGTEHIAVNGGFMVYNNAGSWDIPFQNADSGSVGSLDRIAAEDVTGLSYASVNGQDTGLRYTELDGSYAVNASEDISIVTDTGAGERIATMSQLAYMADGTACIVYTEHDGSVTHVRFAIQHGGGWTLEDVSATPNTFTADDFLVYCDLAHFANGNSIVCYSRFDNDVNTLRVALRTPAP